MATIKGKGRNSSSKAWIGKVRDAAKEAHAIATEEIRQRAEADKEPRSVILDPRRLSGERWDAGKVLHTTLGGVKRPITANDLAAFRHNINTLRGRLRGGGITARQVLDLSLPIDLKRAREQIHHAVPAGFNRGELHLIANAGPDSKDTRHHIKIIFPLIDTAINDVNMTPAQAAKWLTTQPLRFDCDCGKNRYWLRYIATIGDFHAGRAEHGYPKIRNPGLVGVGCKHILRAMTEVESSPIIRSLLARAIDTARDKDIARKKIQIKQKEAEAHADKAPRAIRTTNEITARQNQARQLAAIRAAARTNHATPPPAKRSFFSRAKDFALNAAQKIGVAKDKAMQIISRFFNRPSR